MLKKILIVGLILCGFLVASVSTVVAADEKKSFTDSENDVYDINSENTNTKPNIDIVSIDYVKEGKEITLTLTVKGNIENKGDIGSLESMDEESLNFVSYTLSLYTLDHSYDIIYVNKDYNFTIDAEEVVELTDFIYAGSNLTFIFDLKSQDESYAALEVATYDIYSLSELYMDDFFDITEGLNVEIDAPSTGKVGENIDFSATVSGGTSYEYEWDFDGDLEIDSNAKSPTYTYDEEGTYEITLFVSDSDDKQGYDSFTITISEDGTSNGGSTNGNNQGDSNNAVLLFAAIIVIIVIIGVVVIVLIIRR